MQLHSLLPESYQWADFGENVQFNIVSHIRRLDTECVTFPSILTGNELKLSYV